MKPRMTLKSFEELTAEKLLPATTLPPPANGGSPTGLVAASPVRVLLVQWREAEEFGRVPLPPNAADAPDFWDHWGLNE
jgi:hypothetical protein